VVLRGGESHVRRTRKGEEKNEGKKNVPCLDEEKRGGARGKRGLNGHAERWGAMASILKVRETTAGRKGRK